MNINKEQQICAERDLINRCPVFDPLFCDGITNHMKGNIIKAMIDYGAKCWQAGYLTAAHEMATKKPDIGAKEKFFFEHDCKHENEIDVQ